MASFCAVMGCVLMERWERAGLEDCRWKQAYVHCVLGF